MQEWEISAASEKLAECQESILNLGKQLQALTSSRDAVLSDKFMSTPSRTIAPAATTETTETEKKLTCQRSSLMDRMQAEDHDETDDLESPKTKEMIYAKDSGSQHTGNNATTNNEIALYSMAIVPSKSAQPTSGGLFKKLLKRKKKISSTKVALPFAAA